MTVRRLRANQRGTRCSYCDCRATHRGVYFTRFSCEDHLIALYNEDQVQDLHDGKQSMADWSIGL